MKNFPAGRRYLCAYLHRHFASASAKLFCTAARHLYGLQVPTTPRPAMTPSPYAAHTPLFLWAKTASLGKTIDQGARRAIPYSLPRRLGRRISKKWTGYHRRSLVETKMRYFKLLGERVMARDFDRQGAKLQVHAAILNRFTRLDSPTTVAMP